MKSIANTAQVSRRAFVTGSVSALGIASFLMPGSSAAFRYPTAADSLQWLKPKVQGINVTHVPSDSPFTQHK